MSFRRRRTHPTGPEGELALQASIVETLNLFPQVWAMTNQRHRRSSSKIPTGGLQWPGSSDIVGIIQKSFWGPEGPLVGVFFALEVKKERVLGKVFASQTEATLEQFGFIERVCDFGGIGAVVHSIDEALVALGLR